MRELVKNRSACFSRIANFIVITLLLFSCNLLDKEKNTDHNGREMKKNWREVEALKYVDGEFSAYSRDSGIKKAFLEYLDPNGILLRPGNYPLEGADAFDNLSQIDDKEAEISWQVMDGDVAESGDIGYTYGVYTVKNKVTNDTLQQGTYAMVWKKQKNGNWRLVLDSGSPGLGPKKDSAETGQPDKE